MALCVVTSVASAQQSLKFGNLVDLTGPTSDQGKDMSQGRIDAMQYFNDQGGSMVRRSSW